MNYLDQLKARAQGREVSGAPVPVDSTTKASAVTDGQPVACLPPQVELEHFLRAVLPVAGPSYIMAELFKRGASHRVVDTVQELAHALLAGSDGGCNVYFALGGYRRQMGPISRSRSLVENLRCLWLDVDVGKGDGYATEAEADSALQEFFAALGLPPSFTVHSGAGRHVYWCLSEDLPRHKWDELACSLKRYSTAWALKSDRACTADAARILRAPGTLTKHGNVARVLTRGEIHTASAVRDALERLRKAAGKAQAVALVTADRGPVDLVRPNTRDSNAVLLAGLHAPRSEWLHALPPERQLAMLDELMTACPVASCWDAEPWWSQVVRAVAALNALSFDDRIALLEKHSARSPQWMEDGWTRDRLISEKWRTADGRASLSNLIETAEANGWVRPVDVHMPVPFADRETLEAFLAENFVYVAEQTAYLSRKTRALLPPEAVVESNSWRVPLDPDKPVNLRTMLRTSRKVDRVDKLAYAPGEADIFLRDGSRVANRWLSWNPQPLAPTPDERELWSNFLDHLLPPSDSDAAGFRAWVMQALAWLLADGTRRLPVAVLLVGAQGCGKSTLLEEVPRALFGRANVATVTAAEIESPFTDWLAEARIVTMPELRMGSARDARRVADNLKAIITSDEARIHPKGAKGYTQKNVVSVLASSNHPDALHLEDDDRRWAVCMSPAVRMPDCLAEALYALLKGARGPGVLKTIFNEASSAGFRPHQLPAISAAKQSEPDRSGACRAVRAESVPIRSALVHDRRLSRCVSRGWSGVAGQQPSGCFSSRLPSSHQCGFYWEVPLRHAARAGTHNWAGAKTRSSAQSHIRPFA
jgi:hypothetical protein